MGIPQDSNRNSAVAAETSNGPGQRLRVAREALQLTRDAVALQLRVEVKVIDALEIDDYAKLPAAVFVRGYLRAYSKLVGLVAEPLIEAFDQRTAHTPPPLVLPATVGPDIEARTSYARWIVFALAMLSLLLFYQWWHLEGSKSSPDSVASRAMLPSTQAPDSMQSTEPVAETPVVIPMPETGTLLEKLNETPPDGSRQEEVAGTLPVSAEPTPAPAVVPKVEPEPVFDNPATLAGTLPPVAEPALGVSPDVVTGPLVMRFTDDCWVVIRDVSGRALLQGLIKAGERHVIDGKSPFQLTLGNAPGVEIEYLGQRFDHSRYTGPSKVARFTLGK